MHTQLKRKCHIPSHGVIFSVIPKGVFPLLIRYTDDGMGCAASNLLYSVTTFETPSRTRYSARRHASASTTAAGNIDLSGVL